MPQLFVTVATIGNSLKAFKVLVQNFRLDEGRMQTLLKKVTTNMKKHEHLSSEEARRDSPSNDFVYSLQTALFLLSHMSHDACPVLIYLTDGSASFNQLGLYDNITMQLGRADTKIVAISLADDD